MKLPGDFFVTKRQLTLYREYKFIPDSDNWSFKGGVFAPKGLYTIVACIGPNKRGSYITYVWGETHHGWSVEQF